MNNEQRIYARIDRIINDISHTILLMQKDKVGNIKGMKYMKVYFSSAKREIEEEYGSKNLDEPR